MKRLLYIFLVAAGLAGIAVFPSCSKKVTYTPIKIFSTPLQALINSDTSLSVFYAIVTKAKDSAMYGGIDSITVLIPTNTAFALQGITASTVNAMSPAWADSLLRYYFIPAYDSLTLGSYVFTNKLGTAINGYTDGTNTYFNGIFAVRQPVLGTNASIYELGLLLTPAPDAAALIGSDTSLSYFAEAVKHTNLTLVPASGWNTILAPVDTAFIAAGYPTLGSIDSADITMLTNILQYHILPGQYFSNSFTGLSAVTAAQGSTINITFNTNGLVQFTGTSDTTAAVITVPDRIAAGNVLIQNISGVLKP